MRKANNSQGVSRRKLLKGGILAIGGAITIGLAGPIIRYFVAPAVESGKESWVVIASAQDIPVNKPTHVVYEERVRDKWETTTVSRSAWVVTTDSQHYVVYDPHCTHLGCPYSWIEEGWKGEGPYKGQPHFHSPCHDGIFAMDGTVISGPPPRPLDRLENKVENGLLMVSGKQLTGLTGLA